MEGHPFREAPPQRQLASKRIAAAGSRWGKFLAIGGFTVVWNVICGAIFAAGVSAGEALMIVFTGIFLVVGVILIFVSAHAFLTIFNPTIDLHVSEALPALGDTLDLRWHMVGKASRLRSLKVELLGKEMATYRRGTDTTTDVHVFARIRIAHTDVASEIADGTGSVVIPAGAVPSFDAPDNKIVWVIEIAGDIPNWPDLDDRFELEVIANKGHRKQREASREAAAA